MHLARLFESSMARRLLVSFAFLSVTARIVLAQSAKFVKLQNTDTKLTAINDIEHANVATVTSCIKHCTQTNGCVYVSYNEGQDSCFLHQLNGVTAVSDEGWTIYFKVLDENGQTETDLKAGATASMTTTYSSGGFTFSADLALDGNTDGHMYNGRSCAVANTPYSYWIMQFGSPGVVDKVDIYIRSDYVERNSYRKVRVAQTIDTVTNGMVCGTYEGPLITTSPYLITIQCGSPIFGKFLSINYMLDKPHMEVCEVYVYST